MSWKISTSSEKFVNRSSLHRLPQSCRVTSKPRAEVTGARISRKEISKLDDIFFANVKGTPKNSKVLRQHEA
jgi:hypothetical protein